jgi:hypothetical protein
MTDKTIYLVSCVSGKGPVPAPARELYTSQWFALTRRFVEQTRSPWFILSAEHGLIGADQVIAPYERTLNTMGVEARRAWARGVIEKMETALPAADRCVVLAGERYRENLMDYLRTRYTVEVPMQGLAIGQQLQWLSRRPVPEQDARTGLDCDPTP